MKVLGIGDNVCDIYLHRNKMYPGGQALNFAVYSTMLGEKSEYLGVLGNDEIATHILKVLDEMGIAHPFVKQYPGENGYAVVDIINGDRTFLGSNKGGVSKSNPLIIDKNIMRYIKEFDLIHTSNNSYFDNQVPAVHKLNVPISYDFSTAWKDANRIKRLATYLSFAFISCSELDIKEVQNIANSLLENGTKHVIATLGDRGSVYISKVEIHFHVPKVVEPIDTLGAGDSFAAKFLLEWFLREKEDKVEGKIIDEIMEKAGEFAAKNCLVYGAFDHGIIIPKQILDNVKNIFKKI